MSESGDFRDKRERLLCRYDASQRLVDRTKGLGLTSGEGRWQRPIDEPGRCSWVAL
jgi:hypothetical protein